MSSISSPRKAGRPKRNPELTREAILEVAGKLLAQDGPEGLSVSQVAKLAGVNRGTAYHHFQTREQLLDATKVWVSERLCLEVFGFLPDEDEKEELLGKKLDPRSVADNLTKFVMENPQFGKVWLFEVLSSGGPANDPFWKLYRAHMEAFAKSDRARPGLDPEVHAMMMLPSVFLWPVWVNAETLSPAARRKMSKRYTEEALRMNLHGSLNPDMYPELNAEISAAEEKAKAKGTKSGSK